MNLICGINPVLEALGAGTRHFDRLLIVKGIRNRRISEAISRASRLGVPLRFEGRETLDRLAGGVPHQGIIAVVSAKPLMSVDELLATARDPALVVVLDGVEDPRNLGAILRTVEAAGAAGVLLPERHSAGLSDTVNRTSAGALEHVRVARIGNVAQTLEQLKARGFWVVGFDAAGTDRWDAVDYRRPIALVLGGEGRGIRRLVRERCDHVAAVPLFGHVTSLNVSVVAGIALYEAVRQRGSVPSQVRPIPVRPPSAVRQVVGPGPEDREQDPGLPLAQGVGLAVVGDGDGDAEEAPEAIGVVELHEEPEWAGPVVLKSRDHGPRRHRRHDGRAPRRHGSPGPRREEPGTRPGERRPDAGEAPPGGAGGAPSHDASRRDGGRDGPGRRRRRRHGRRGQGAGERPAGHSAAHRAPQAGAMEGGQAPAQEGSGVGSPSGEAPPSPEGQPAGTGEGRRSRRRRRRRR